MLSEIKRLNDPRVFPGDERMDGQTFPAAKSLLMNKQPSLDATYFAWRSRPSVAHSQRLGHYRPEIYATLISESYKFIPLSNTSLAHLLNSLSSSIPVNIMRA